MLCEAVEGYVLLVIYCSKLGTFDYWGEGWFYFQREGITWRFREIWGHRVSTTGVIKHVM